MVGQREIDIGTIIFSDESHIYLRGFMNEHNFISESGVEPNLMKFTRNLYILQRSGAALAPTESTGHISLKILKEMHGWLQQTLT